MASETEPNYYYLHSRNFSPFSAIRLWLLPALWSRGSQSPRNKSVPQPHWLALSRIAYPDQLQRSRPREGNSIGSMPCPSKQLRLQLPIRLEGGQSAPPPHGGGGSDPVNLRQSCRRFLFVFNPAAVLTLVQLIARAQALRRPVLQSQPSLSFPEETANPQEALLSLGETEAEGARLFSSSLDAQPFNPPLPDSAPLRRLPARCNPLS